MKMNIISRGKTYGNHPLEIPRDEIFVFEEEQKENQFKNASHIAGYNILRVHKLDHTSLLYIGACNVGISSFLSLVFNCARVVIDLPPS